jgi:hypothetical protein
MCRPCSFQETDYAAHPGASSAIDYVAEISESGYEPWPVAYVATIFYHVKWIPENTALILLDGPTSNQTVRFARC